MYFKNISKTLMRLEQLERNRKKVKKLQALTLSICLFFSCVGNEQWNRTRSVVIYAQERIKGPFILS